MIKGNAGYALLVSIQSQESKPAREAPSEMLRGFGVDTGTIYVSTVNCFCFNSVTGINDEL